jgi:hypothetical protein
VWITLSIRTIRKNGSLDPQDSLTGYEQSFDVVHLPPIGQLHVPGSLERHEQSDVMDRITSETRTIPACGSLNDIGQLQVPGSLERYGQSGVMDRITLKTRTISAIGSFD